MRGNYGDEINYGLSFSKSDPAHRRSRTLSQQSANGEIDSFNLLKIFSVKFWCYVYFCFSRRMHKLRGSQPFAFCVPLLNLFFSCAPPTFDDTF